MIKVAMHNLYENGVGEKIGYVFMFDTEDGLAIESSGLSIPRDGYHGMHIHEFGDLTPSTKPSGEKVRGGNAGQHYDPDDSGYHAGPFGFGHRGDLPKILVRNGEWSGSVVAPRLSLAEVKDRALIIHSGGDNYSDSPKPNGGGMSRIIGGVISNDCPYCKDPMAKFAKWILGGAAAWYFLNKPTK
jgi:superoxide dismutase, Cu-Zn family